MGAYEKNLVIATVPAAGNLSTQQFHWVKLDADGKAAAIAADTDIPFGILQNNPNATDKAAEVAVGGISICIAGGNLDEGMGVGPKADGHSEDHTTVANKYIGGRAVTAATGDGTQFSVLIAPVAIRGAA
jgi:hypothetical protein